MDYLLSNILTVPQRPFPLFTSSQYGVLGHQRFFKVPKGFGGLVSKFKGNGTFRKEEAVEAPHSTEFFDCTKIMLTHSHNLIK